MGLDPRLREALETADYAVEEQAGDETGLLASLRIIRALMREVLTPAQLQPS